MNDGLLFQVTKASLMFSGAIADGVTGLFNQKAISAQDALTVLAACRDALWDAETVIALMEINKPGWHNVPE